MTQEKHIVAESVDEAIAPIVDLVKTTLKVWVANKDNFVILIKKDKDDGDIQVTADNLTQITEAEQDIQEIE